MPNSLGPAGLTTASQTELVTNETTQLQQIYGADINLNSDTPDGQWLNIQVQAVVDVLDLLTQIYNSFDPGNAVGAILDQRCAINGVIRKAGTFTITNITIVTSQSVNLYGLDQSVQPIYTISDNAGNLWELQTTQLGVSSGTHVFAFQSAIVGAVLTVPNTINVPVTIVLGVVSVNNPTTYTILGIPQESDANLRLRRQQSVSISSQGYLPGLLATLLNITGVTVAFVYENDTDSTDGDGVPGHSIWAIVGGSAAPVAIATAIYNKKNAGCGMFGAQTYTIIQVNGLPITISWDNVVQELLYIQFNATSLDGINAPNVSLIKAQLPLVFTPGVFVEVNINELATLVQQIDPNTLVTNAGFSTAALGSYTNTLTPSAKNKQFEIMSGNISITIV